MNLEKVLPPGVNGKISGRLMVKVDEVFWCRSSPGEIVVELLWWGERDSTIFRPEDITQSENTHKNNCSVTYNIRTSPGLFETYLRNCGKLTFTVLRGQNKNVIVGSTIIKDIHEIISKKTYSSYFPIFSPKKFRIGDLHITFDLNFVVKQAQYADKCEVQLMHTKESRKKQLSSKSSTTASQEDQLLSEILQKGNELRKAMMMSVLADCPIDKIDGIIADKKISSLPNKCHVRKNEKKLVDFLLGKDMTAEEEKQAVETLRCLSPDDNLMNLAKLEKDTSDIKSTCCLHGSQCNNKISQEQQSSPTPTLFGPTLHLAASSKDPQSESALEKKVEAENKMEKNYNCYRVIAKTLNLTNDGIRKIYYAPALAEIDEPMKSKRVNHPPGTSFILEIVLPSKKNPWSRTLKFTTKDYRDKNVIFGQGTSHRLCGTVTWPRVKSQILGSVFTIYWRHLNQRVPCPLGCAKLEEFDPSLDSNSISLSLPLYSNTRMLTGHLQLSINLGFIQRGGGEALFHLKEKCASPQVVEALPPSKDIVDYDGLTSEISSKPPILSERTKESDRVDIISSDDDIQYKSEQGLDDELLRTINLLNSKPVPRDDSPKSPKRKTTSVKSRIKGSKEACVQTTLPLTNPACPNCYHSDVPPQIRNEIPDHDSITNLRDLVDKSPPEKLERVENDYHVPLNGRACRQPAITRSHPMYNDYCHANEKFYRDANLKERLRVAPSKYNGTEKIHEYSIHIEKVVGVPLFTGDNDLDCYVDYMFPKVDADGIMTLDRIHMGTEVRIALRETEFGTVSKHRLRLSCKLTRALLTLPSTELIFSLWGRSYRPTPQDFRLGKATLPLTKLSSLEMKYEQQRQQQPVNEKFILPLVPLDSFLTRGYKGPFGELHIIIGYSKASGLSYREWRCKNKDDHYWCRSHLCNSPNKVAYTEPNYECVKTQSNFSKIDLKNHLQNVQSQGIHSTSNFRAYDSLNQPRFPTDVINCISDVPKAGNDNLDALKDFNTVNPEHPLRINLVNPLKNSQDSRGTYSKTILPNTDHYRLISDGVGQMPLEDYVTDNQWISGCSNGVNNEGFPCRNGFSRNHVYNPYEKLQQVTEIDSFKPNESLLLNKNGFHNSGFEKRENIVKKVLKDIQERKQLEKKLAGSAQLTKPVQDEVIDLDESGDAFNSFNLRTELPKNNDVSDFDVRSQYSFLQTPEPSLPFNNCLNLESPSSSSIRHRMLEGQTLNPFSSQSNISLNSNSSMFKKTEKNSDNDKFTEQKLDKSLDNKHLQGETPLFVKSLESEVSSRKNNITNRKKEENYQQNLSEKENSCSSNGTLKSVESLNDIIPSETNNNIITSMEVNNGLSAPLDKSKYFKARVEICRALGLPSLEIKQLDGKIALVKPNSHAYFNAIINGVETTLRTRAIEKKSNPVWESSWDVHLPVELLKKSDIELEIFVDLSCDGDATTRTSDISINWPIVLRTGVDLTPITAGLENASGWYSLSDRALMSRAQIKVIVTPLEDISSHRDDWLKEYTKSKGKRREVLRPEMRSSLATSLQEKLFELEKLTQRMKDKMAARSQWDESPPLSLLSEVQEVSLGVHREDISILPFGVREKLQHKSCNNSDPDKPDEVSAIVISDGDSDDRGSYEVVNTYTVSQGSGDDKISENEDSLETSSQAIDRIITKVRENR